MANHLERRRNTDDVSRSTNPNTAEETVRSESVQGSPTSSRRKPIQPSLLILLTSAIETCDDASFQSSSGQGLTGKGVVGISTDKDPAS